jgi:hypothetical protein
MTKVDEKDEAYTSARELAWRHFDFHAKQRIDMFKSYLTLITIVYVGLGVAIQSKIYMIGILFCLLLICFSVLFYLFDLRNRQLVRISESYLLSEEKRISKIIAKSDIRLFYKSNLITHFSSRHLRLTYSNLLRLLFGLNAVVALVFAAIFIAMLSMSI